MSTNSQHVRRYLDAENFDRMRTVAGPNASFLGFSVYCYGAERSEYTAKRLRGMREDAEAYGAEMRTLGGHIYFLFGRELEIARRLVIYKASPEQGDEHCENCGLGEDLPGGPDEIDGSTGLCEFCLEGAE